MRAPKDALQYSYTSHYVITVSEAERLICDGSVFGDILPICFLKHHTSRIGRTVNIFDASFSDPFRGKRFRVESGPLPEIRPVVYWGHSSDIRVVTYQTFNV